MIKMNDIEMFDAETIWASVEYGQKRWPSNTEFVKYEDIKHLIEKEVIICTGINKLNDCPRAYLGEGFFGCKYKDHCQFKRPRIPTPKETIKEIAKINRCRTCKYWKHIDKGSFPHEPGFGSCSCKKFIEHGTSERVTDGLVYWDYEGYSAGFKTGENFGCIHWEKIK